MLISRHLPASCIFIQARTTSSRSFFFFSISILYIMKSGHSSLFSISFKKVVDLLTGAAVLPPCHIELQ